MALSQHPMVAQPGTKEPHWWTRESLSDMGQDYLQLALLQYLVNFVEANKKIRRDPQLISYDGSQSTLWDSNFFTGQQDYCAMPVAVSHVLPRAKFVVIMRDPVARTYSHFLYSCSYKYGDNMARWPPGVRRDQAGTFHHEVLETILSFNSCLSAGSSTLECINWHHFSQSSCGHVGYRLMVSLYHVHLRKWLQRFPREQFLFLRMEDMSRDADDFMRRITDFLDISQIEPNLAKKWLSRKENKQTIRRRGQRWVTMKMRPETRTLLTDFFTLHNKQLVELTGDERFLWDTTP